MAIFNSYVKLLNPGTVPQKFARLLAPQSPDVGDAHLKFGQVVPERSPSDWMGTLYSPWFFGYKWAITKSKATITSKR